MGARPKSCPSRLVVREVFRSPLDLFLQELHLQPERIGETIRQVSEAGQEVDVDDLGIVEVLSQHDEIGVVDRVGIAGELLGVGQGSLFLRAEAGVLPCLSACQSSGIKPVRFDEAR